jgi:hypothetical protein
LADEPWMGKFLESFFFRFWPAPTTNESHVIPSRTLHCLTKGEGAYSKVWVERSRVPEAWGTWGCKT